MNRNNAVPVITCIHDFSCASPIFDLLKQNPRRQ